MKPSSYHKNVNTKKPNFDAFATMRPDLSALFVPT